MIKSTLVCKVHIEAMLSLYIVIFHQSQTP